METLAPGTRIGRYTIEGLAGRGGMGEVYRARQDRPRRTVALKVLPPQVAEDERFRRRFEREWEAAAEIEHPHVVPVYEVGEDGGRLFLAMRLVEGVDLGRLLRDRGWLPPERAGLLADQVASALEAAHRRGLVHRDVKPANVLVTEDDGDLHAYLTDFGLTKRADASEALTGTGMWVGTVDYIAPEQLDGRPVDARADVYALGAVLFHVLTGRPPFEGTPAEKLQGHLHAEPPSPRAVAANVPEALDAVVRRAMAKGPADRFASAAEMGRATLAAVGLRRRGSSDLTAVAAVAREDARGDDVPDAHAGVRRRPDSDPAVPEPTVAAAADGPVGARRRRRAVLAAAAVAGVLALVGLAFVAGVFTGEERAGGTAAPAPPAGGAPEPAPGEAPPGEAPGAAPEEQQARETVVRFLASPKETACPLLTTEYKVARWKATAGSADAECLAEWNLGGPAEVNAAVVVQGRVARATVTYADGRTDVLALLKVGDRWLVHDPGLRDGEGVTDGVPPVEALG